ncbi:hypothetical protein AMATHDRAFT_150565 [Amanita thiersii Skay4041]|uniref:Uncharacterized protein n=1 Tax=Amanita thiersii Skay4041 TaxID=703135 RepID=A0A2A9NIN7_9AGAR|nr:hypothetical protein AMATHDRAFT_150565 [Amanita thiersii Skay4041]
MKALFTTAALFISTVSLIGISNAAPQDVICIGPLCQPDPPDCKPGSLPLGSPGCWACCAAVAFCMGLSPQTTVTQVCPDICYSSPPLCPIHELPSGRPGCWGCCVPIVVCHEIAGVVCAAVCLPDPPTCPRNQAPSGMPNCWGCCQPVGNRHRG